MYAGIRSLPSKTSLLTQPKTAVLATRDVGTLTTSAVGFQHPSPAAGKTEGKIKTDGKQLKAFFSILPRKCLCSDRGWY